MSWKVEKTLFFKRADFSSKLASREGEEAEFWSVGFSGAAETLILFISSEKGDTEREEQKLFLEKFYSFLKKNKSSLIGI